MERDWANAFSYVQMKSKHLSTVQKALHTQLPARYPCDAPPFTSSTQLPSCPQTHVVSPLSAFVYSLFLTPFSHLVNSTWPLTPGGKTPLGSFLATAPEPLLQA